MNLSPVVFPSLDAAQHAVLSHLLSFGETTSPRGLATLESRGVSFSIADPRARCVLNTARRWSLPLALGELCWHLSEETRVEGLAYYAPVWREFADNGGHVRGSCYGAKVFREGQESPWRRAQHLLRTDRATRRAVLYFNDPSSHLAPECRDAACASSLQFLVREEKLEAIVTMRSNDAIWGLPYDVFLFTFLQELMAVELGYETGPYQHFAASIHLYQKHLNLAARIVDCASEASFPMPAMRRPDQIPRFLAHERAVRGGGQTAEDTAGLDSYWTELVDVLVLFRNAKAEGWEKAWLKMTANSYDPVLEPLRKKTSVAAAV